MKSKLNICLNEIMAITTTTYFTTCLKYNREISVYYTEIGVGECGNRLCVDCYTKFNEDDFPMGSRGYLPCKLCKPPKINWYEDPYFHDDEDNCGNHK